MGCLPVGLDPGGQNGRNCFITEHGTTSAFCANFILYYLIVYYSGGEISNVFSGQEARQNVKTPQLLCGWGVIAVIAFACF